MQVLIVNQEEVPRFLPMAECMEAVAAALAGLADGEACSRCAPSCGCPKSRGFGLMRRLSAGRVVGLKAITFFRAAGDRARHAPGPSSSSRPSAGGFSPCGRDPITAIRTAAASGVATRPSRAGRRRPRAIGSGTQARTHLKP
jgi:ornithine cyclodeaminase/alanine dehydrogenase-like protein (mu-crystallin family)